MALRQEHTHAQPWDKEYYDSGIHPEGLHHLVNCCIWVLSRGFGRQPRVREGDHGVERWSATDCGTTEGELLWCGV